MTEYFDNNCVKSVVEIENIRLFSKLKILEEDAEDKDKEQIVEVGSLIIRSTLNGDLDTYKVKLFIASYHIPIRL